MIIFYIMLVTLAGTDGKSRLTDRCPSSILQWKRQEMLFSCPADAPYHCILKYNTSQLYEACIATVTIGPGVVGCPWILFHQGVPIHGSINSECHITNPECPPANHKGYLSNQLYQYPACFIQRSARSSYGYDIITSEPPRTIKAGTSNHSSELEDTNESQRTIFIAIGVSAVVILVVILLIVIGLLKRGKYCRSWERSSNRNKNDSDGWPDEEDSTLMKTDDSKLDLTLSPKDVEPTLNQQKMTNNQQQEDIRRVLKNILEISDGVVSYEKIRSHFEQKENCSVVLKNLENILRRNGHVFRLIEGESIHFVIAYMSVAEICEDYNTSSLAAGQCVEPNCSKFHICTSYVRSVCRKQICNLFHTYGDTHNLKLKEKLRLSNFTDIDINNILRNRYPKICITSGCDKDEDCPYLHICSKFCVGHCVHGVKCIFGHSFKTKHNDWILKAYDIAENDIFSGSPIARKLTMANRV